jgi:predicted nucleic acid-binding protein
VILVDTMIWADHIVRPDPRLTWLLAEGRVLTHPFVVGELALGNLRDRAVLRAFDQLPRASTAFDGEVLDFIERHSLGGSGIGYVDAHLLVAARLTPDTRIWTRDRRLGAAAARLGVSAEGQ